MMSGVASFFFLNLDEKAKKLLDSLRKLRFKNGASGHVRTGQEFAYISQCGLYTEPQNVSFVSFFKT